MRDTPAHASGAERGRAEVPRGAGSAVRDSGDRGGRALRGGAADSAPVDGALPGRTESPDRPTGLTRRSTIRGGSPLGWRRWSARWARPAHRDGAVGAVLGF